MSHWIELSHSSLFGPGLDYRSNIDDFPALEFVHRSGKMAVKSGRGLDVSIDTWDHLSINGRVYQREWKVTPWGFRRRGDLRAADATIAIGVDVRRRWGLADTSLTCSRNPQASYAVRHLGSRWIFDLGTRARIESLTDEYDLDLMIACLAYFWTGWEEERMWDSAPIDF